MKLLSIKKLPLVPVLVAIFLAMGLLLFINAYSKREAFSQFNLWGGTEIAVESEVKDTDNDGLQDWEENLYQTDYLNPDTDGDGYLDGEEINSGHNPLVKAPGDNQIFYPLPIGDKYNLTQKIFFDLDVILKSYIDQKNQYIEDHSQIESQEEFLAQISPQTLEEMYKRAMLYNEEDWLGKAETILAELPEVFNIEIPDSELVFSDNNSQEAIKVYAEKLIAYLTSKNFLLQDKNFVLLKNSLDNNNLSEIDALIKNSNSEIADFIKTPVPASWKEIHKKTLKISITLRNIFVSLRGYETDPVKAMIAAGEFERLLSEWENLNKEIETLNKSQNLNLSL